MLDFVKKRPGFIILCILLSVITLVSLKPQFYLAGWDNYSSYFNLKTNIFRTFFATWREYRGLGVPSDAEVNDIFRQIFYWSLHFFVPEQLLDQLYYILALWVGILGMYAFASLIIHDFNLKKNDLFSTVTALFYLFNLNTLSVFYSPIIPFTNRFYSLPLTLFFFLKFLRKMSIRNGLILAIVIIVTSGSYITPTVLITSFIAFFLFILVRSNIRKTVIFCLFFLLLNAFWILPFINYTIHKSSIIPLARTFVEINESTLNRPASAFSLEKQATLYPSFLEISFPSINGSPYILHPLLKEYEKLLNRMIFLIFPALYGIGIFFILIRWQKYKKILWIPIWILFFLFLSTKEFGPLGFAYLLLKKFISYFDILFRISDTKFHVYISFAGSVAAAYVVVSIISFIREKKFFYPMLILCIAVSIGYIWPFRSYFTGNLIGFFAYTKIPEAYYQIAEKINSDPEKGRVLHLPIDNVSHYWRSFSWGYLGSAYFNYFINKPYIDKTFEPASMENTYLHLRINALLDSFYRSSDQSQKKQEAYKFLRLLQEVGIQYVLVDHSISSEIYTRNISYTAKQFAVKSDAMMKFLSQEGRLAESITYPISLEALYPFYRKLYPVTKTGLPNNLPTETSVDLYKINTIQPMFSSVSSAKYIDPNLDNLLDTKVNTFEKTLIQNKEKPSILYPFLEQNHKATRENNAINISYPNSNTNGYSFQINLTPTDINSYLIDVYGKKHNQVLTLSFYHRYYPDINGKQFQTYIGSIDFRLPDEKLSSGKPAYLVSNWTQNSGENILEAYRLHLNDVFVPIPSPVLENETYITSYMLHEKIIKAALFNETLVQDINSSTFSQTNVRAPIVFPNLRVETKQYLEIELKIKGESTLHAYICLQQGAIKQCLNPHRNIRTFSDESTYRIATNSLISNQLDTTIEIASIPNANLKQTLEVKNISEHFYSPVQEKEISFNPIFPKQSVILSDPLQISFPKAVSTYSYIHKPQYEFFDVPQEQCRKDNPNPRIIRFDGDILVNTMENCSVYFAQSFQYAFQHPYLFAFEYWLERGQQPNIVLGRKSDDYLLERVGLYQGYPNIKSSTGSRFIDPMPISDTYSQNAAIHLFQDTANKGVLAVRSFDMLEYPPAWQNMALVPDGAETNYDVPSGTIFSKQILPSLWRIEFLSQGKNMILFNEGYDREWGIYENILDLIVGKTQAKSYRCNGYANCFEIAGRPGSYYIFYAPEKLYFLGWVVTLLTFGIIAFFLLKKPTTSLNA